MMRLARVDFFTICDSAPVPFVGGRGGETPVGFGEVVCMMRLARVDFFTICDSAPVPFVGAKGTKSAS